MSFLMTIMKNLFIKVLFTILINIYKVKPMVLVGACRTSLAIVALRRWLHEHLQSPKQNIKKITFWILLYALKTHLR
jgi:hypothetical protein